MEVIASMFIPAILLGVALHMLAMPLRWGYKLLLHVLCGWTCLWLLNSAAGITSLYIPINAVTATLAGFGGLPGIALLAVLELL